MLFMTGSGAVLGHVIYVPTMFMRAAPSNEVIARITGFAASAHTIEPLRSLRPQLSTPHTLKRQASKCSIFLLPLPFARSSRFNVLTVVCLLGTLEEAQRKSANLQPLVK